MLRKIVLVVVSVLFLGTVIGVVRGFSVPTEKEEHVTHLTYQLEGDFNHRAYEKSTPEIKPNPKYFTKIIDSINVHYNYRFLTEEPVTSTTTKVAISALIQSRGNWEKELVLVPPTTKTGDFTISFPLDTAPLLIVADNISQELGVGGSPDIVLKATVHTVARTRAGVVEDDFAQTTTIKLSGNILEWDRDLALSEIGYAAGLKYEHQGNFSYTIELQPSILFGEVTLPPEIPPASANVTSANVTDTIQLQPDYLLGAVTLNSEIPPPVEPVALKPSDSYKSETIDRIDGTFSFKFESDEALSDVVNEVEVTAAVGEVGGTHETFVLVPKSQETGGFSANFSLDVPLFYAVIQSIEEETGASAPSHELTITADVHTVAESEFGPIDETFSQKLVVSLGQDEVWWPEVTPETKEGSIEETMVVPNTGATTAKVGSLGALVMIATILAYSIWSYREFKHKWISRIEADALLIKNKRPDLVVDVETLPDIGKEGTVAELGSLGELIKTADSLFKPILHLAEPERHIYCVIDGLTRYQYISLPQYVSLSESQ